MVSQAVRVARGPVAGGLGRISWLVVQESEGASAGHGEKEREIVVRIRSERDDLRDVVVALTEDVRRLDALLRDFGGQALRAAQPPALLDKRALAACLDVSVRQVDRLVARGDLPPTLRVGSSPRWKRAQVDAYVDGATSRRRGKS